MAGSPSGVWPNGVEEAMEAGSPGRLLEALALGSRGASEVPPARSSWADLDGESLPPPGDFFAGSPGLLRAYLGRGPAERVALSDSEADSDPEPSPSVAPSSSTPQAAAVGSGSPGFGDGGAVSSPPRPSLSPSARPQAVGFPRTGEADPAATTLSDRTPAASSGAPCSPTFSVGVSPAAGARRPGR